MNLVGSFPPELGNLSFLVSLDIRGNNFNGSLPEELGALRRLRVMRLSHNKFSGDIPYTLGFLSELQYLALTNNSFTGTIPSSIFNLSNLEALHMSSNSLQGKIPEMVRELPNLRILDMGGNQLEGTIPENLCRSLPNLEELYLWENRLIGRLPSSLQECSSLQVLSLFQNNFNGSIPREIGNLTMLVGLHIHNNNLTGEIPQEISSLYNLKQIFLASNSLSGSIPPGIFNISTLTRIALAFNQLSGNLPSNMGCSLPNLSELKLHVNDLSGEIPACITNSSGLKVLALNTNRFTGPIPNNLGDLRLLQLLNLAQNDLINHPSSQELSFITSLTKCKNIIDIEVSENPLNGILPSSIGNLSTSLLYIYAPVCQIKGSIPQEIGNLSNLMFLSLFGNQLTGSIPTTVVQLQQLQELYLQQNAINGSIPNALCQLKILGGLGLQENQISGTIPDCLGNATSLRYLYMDNNKLVNRIPSNFWKLKDLLELTLSENSLSGSLSPDIGSLRALLALDLSSNQFSGDIPITIGGLSKLNNLSLAYNRFEGSIPDSIGSMLSLVVLNLSHNNLSGQIPKSLEKLRDLSLLNVSYNRLIGEIPSLGTFKNFTSQSFMFNEALCGAPIFNVPPCSGNSAHSSRKTQIIHIILIVLGIAAAILALTIAIFLMRYKRKHPDPVVADPLPSTMPGKSSYYELLQATNGYSESNCLGTGSYGTVYKGILNDGTVVAVKVFNWQLEGAFRSFDTECEAFRNLRHRNLAKVISCCSNNDFKAIVLEYMTKGSLEQWLYSHNYFLVIMQRLDIMIDVACALDYLHHGFSVPVVHCDIKPSNVLLDENMVAHLSDFGIAKLLSKDNSAVHTKTLATLGYVAPEYGMEGFVSTRCDVYSFGIMLMEVFTRVKPNDEIILGDMSLKSWVNASMPNAAIQVIDSNLISPNKKHLEGKLKCLASVLGLALRCSAESARERMTMNAVLASLKNIKLELGTYC